MEIVSYGCADDTADKAIEEVRRLVTKSRGRPRNLTKSESRRLGRLAAKAASAAASSSPKKP